ncbi:MAG TPA: hypothetical protein VGB73_05045 [Pyrinomonadaceae bacterium]
MLLLFAHAPQSVVRANMAAPQPESRAGDRVVEPAGDLKSVHIERETLTVDLRPLAEGRPAVVEAIYRVRSDGAETQTLNLLFLADALAPQSPGGWRWEDSRWVARKTGGQARPETGVWLDNQPVQTETSERPKTHLPPSWRSPETTPTLRSGEEELPYDVTSGGAIAFRVVLTPGTHVFRVRYEARPAAYSGVSSSAIYWQLGYILAPAREWASFGGLDAKVLLPRGWKAATAPAMRREGDTLTASWNEVPADALAITVQTSEETVSNVAHYWMWLIVFSLLLAPLAGFVGWKLGRKLSERRRTSAWALLVSPLVAALSVFLSSLFAELFSRPSAADQAAFNRVGDYSFIITAPLLLLAFLLTLFVTQLCAFLARRRAARRLP